VDSSGDVDARIARRNGQSAERADAGLMSGFGSFNPSGGGFEAASDCDGGAPGNALEVSLSVDQGLGMIGIIPKIFQDQIKIRKIKLLGYVVDGRGYIQIL